MQVLMLNGSPRPNGNTNRALKEIGATLEAEGIGAEIVQIGAKPVRDCIACRKCAELGKCIFDDAVNEFVQKAAQFDGFVFGTPVYYAHPSGAVLSFLDRAFYSCDKSVFRHKPAAAVAIARRAGTTASLDVMNKYFGITQMPVVSSTYWNLAHGQQPGELEADGEGLQTMRNIGHGMAWLLKSIEAGRAAGVPAPTTEFGTWTNFVR